MKKPLSERFGDFMAGKGFYIVLFLCVAAIGISGYYLFASLSPSKDPGTTVAGPAQVVVTPAPVRTPAPAVSPAPPVITTTPRPVPQATPTPAPSTPAPSAPPTAAPAPTPPAAAPTSFTWPVEGETLTPHNLEVLAYDATMGDWRAHAGLDIAAGAGEPVTTAAAGLVIDVVQDDLMGTTVYVDHGGGLTSSYANLAANPPVAAGDWVNAGAVLGNVDQTAIAESALPSHLHFEMAQDGSPVNPLDYLP